MKMTSLSPLAALLASAASFAFVATDAGAATPNDNIGTVSALNQQVEGTPPNADTRQLSIRDGLFSNERIDSSPIGSGQFLFLDQTTLTIAKNSSLVLDKYVYDPSTKTGEFALSMSRGVLRFVGGRITKGTDAVITTPTATIGIRGGMAIIIVDQDGTTRVMHIAGDYTRVTRLDGGDDVVVSRANGVVEIPFGGAPRYVGVADQELITETTLELIGRGDAGEKVEPQDPDVVESGVPSANSAAKGAAKNKPISTRGESNRDGDDDDDEENNRIGQYDEEVAGLFPGQNLPPAPDNTPPDNTPPDNTPPDNNPDPTDPDVSNPPDNNPPDNNPPGAGPTLLAGVTGSASISGSGVPGLASGGGQTFVFTQVFEGSRIGVTAAGERFSIPTEAGFFSFTSATGSSPAGGISGSGFFDPVGEFTYAVFQTDGGATGAFLAGAPSDPLAGAGEGERTARSYTLSDDLFAGSGPAFTGGLTGFSDAGQGQLTLLSNAGGAATGDNARAVAAFFQITGTGVTQTSGLGVFTGDVSAADAGTPAFSDFFDGVFRDGSGEIHLLEDRVVTIEDGQGGSAFGVAADYFALGNSNGVGGAATAGRLVDEAGTATLYGANHVADRTAVAALDAGAPLAFSSPGGFAAISGVDLGNGQTFVGASSRDSGVILTVDPSTNSAAMSVRIDDFFSGLDGETTVRPDIFDLRATFGGGSRGAAIDADRFAARQSTIDEDQFANFVNGLQTAGRQDGQNAFSGVMASAGLVGDGGIFPAGVDTAPEFMRWGWWAGEFRHDPDQIGNPNNEGVELESDQRFHLGAWVAGDLTGSDNLPPSGIATYDGFAAISVVENGSAYVDGAGFGMTYDFGQNAGIVTLTDVIGSDASIAVDSDVFGADYAGAAGINVNGREGIIGVQGSFFNAGATPAGATGGSIDLATFDGAISGAGVFAGDRTSFDDGRLSP